jgi:hypothetical protein
MCRIMMGGIKILLKNFSKMYPFNLDKLSVNIVESAIVNKIYHHLVHNYLSKQILTNFLKNKLTQYMNVMV